MLEGEALDEELHLPKQHRRLITLGGQKLI